MSLKGSVVVADHTAAFCALASYTYWCYLRRVCWAWAVVSGITLGLAQACKFSMLVLYPAWWLLALAARWSLRREEAVRTPEAGPTFPQVAVICAISLLVLNAIYGFDGTGKPIGSFSFRSHLLTGKQTRSVDEPPAANRFRGTWGGTFPCPLPKHYVLGFDSQKWEEEGNFVRLVDGHLVQRGRWYSPLTTMAYKLPLGSIALLGLSAVFWVVRSRRFKLVELAILVPAFFVVGLMCTQTGLNWLYRYTLPALPLLCVAIGRPVQLLWRSRSFRFFVIACLIWNGIGIFRVRPNYFAYGNELIGGPAGAQRVFLGSNFDWGQDLYRFKQWYESQPGMRPMLMTYYGVIEPRDLGIRDRGIPARFLQAHPADWATEQRGHEKPLYWAISSNILHGIPGNIELDNGYVTVAQIKSPYLKPERAVARIGYTIYVFRIDPAPSGHYSANTITYDMLDGCLHELQGLDRVSLTSP